MAFMRSGELKTTFPYMKSASSSRLCPVWLRVSSAEYLSAVIMDSVMLSLFSATASESAGSAWRAAAPAFPQVRRMKAAHVHSWNFRLAICVRVSFSIALNPGTRHPPPGAWLFPVRMQRYENMRRLETNAYICFQRSCRLVFKNIVNHEITRTEHCDTEAGPPAVAGIRRRSIV